MEGTRHLPVLLSEIIGFLRCQADHIYVDATLGSGGHARAILEHSSPTGKLVALDWDKEAIRRARENLAPFGNRVEIREENFKNLKDVLESLSIERVDGILLDLGVSTEQLEEETRGFSFRRDGPLDMRMSHRIQRTAQDLLQRLSVSEIEEVLHRYGEERWSRRIAKGIVRRRQVRPIRTTRELAELIQKCVPFSRGRIHPATRAFQALRLAVNEEIENLETFLTRSKDLLNPEGRLGVISFHSLEDRIVKNHFRRWAKAEKGEVPSFQILTPKPVVPSPAEVLANPRARSAKLRVIDKLTVNCKGGSHGRSDL